MFVCPFFLNWCFLLIDQLYQDCGYKIPSLKITTVVQLRSPGSWRVCKLYHSSSTKRWLRKGALFALCKCSPLPVRLLQSCQGTTGCRWVCIPAEKWFGICSSGVFVY